MSHVDKGLEQTGLRGSSISTKAVLLVNERKLHVHFSYAGLRAEHKWAENKTPTSSVLASNPPPAHFTDEELESQEPLRASAGPRRRGRLHLGPSPATPSWVALGVLMVLWPSHFPPMWTRTQLFKDSVCVCMRVHI